MLKSKPDVLLVCLQSDRNGSLTLWHLQTGEAISLEMGNCELDQDDGQVFVGGRRLSPTWRNGLLSLVAYKSESGGDIITINIDVAGNENACFINRMHDFVIETLLVTDAVTKRTTELQVSLAFAAMGLKAPSQACARFRELSQDTFGTTWLHECIMHGVAEYVGGARLGMADGRDGEPYTEQQATAHEGRWSARHLRELTKASATFVGLLLCFSRVRRRRGAAFFRARRAALHIILATGTIWAKLGPDLVQVSQSLESGA